MIQYAKKSREEESDEQGAVHLDKGRQYMNNISITENAAERHCKS